MSREDTKAIMKAAIKEWLDAQFAVFGKFALGSLVSVFLAMAIYAALQFNGWKPPVP